MEKRNFQLTVSEIRALTEETDAGRASGYAAVFHSDSHDLGGFIEVIQPGAFTRSIKAAAAGSLNIFALWSHDCSLPLGSTGSGKLKLVEDVRGLTFDLDTKRFTPAQLDSLADNELKMSFGFSVREQEWKELDDGSIIRTLIDVDLFEVSFVINPAYPDTSAAKRSLEEWRSSHRKVEVPAINVGELHKRALTATLRARGKLG